MQFLDGTITDLTPQGDITIRAHFDNIESFMRCGYSTARILLNDSRTITAEQRKKIYAMLTEIAEFVGDFPEIVKKTMKWEFRLQRLEKMEKMQLLCMKKWRETSRCLIVLWSLQASL